MKATTLQSRIEKNLFTKKGTLHSRYINPIGLLKHPDTVARPRKWNRNGSHMTLVDSSHNYVYVLTVLGIDYETGNDAPRCGAEGYYIKLTKKGRNQVRDFAKQFNS